MASPLTVGLSTDEFNKTKGKKSYFSYDQRKEFLEAIRYVDAVIPEDDWAQKADDIVAHQIDIFTMGDDWKGKFDALADNLPLRRKMEKLIDRTLINGIFKCGFVSLNSGKYYSVAHNEFVSNEHLVNGVIASTSIPAVWKPVESVKFVQNDKIYESKYNVDGGLMNMSPLGDAIKVINEDPDDCEWKIIVINCHSGKPTVIDAAESSIFGIASRSIYELTLNEIFNNDIDHFLEVNRIVEQVRAWDYEITLHNRLKQVIKKFDAVIINPQPTFGIGNPLVSSKRLIQSRYDHGYQMAANRKYF